MRTPVPHRAVTLAVAAVALAVRLAWGLSTRVPPTWDGELYERGARALASGLGYSCFLFGPAADPSVPTAFYPVGYPAFLGALYLLLGVHPWVIVVGGACLGAVTAGLTHRLALRCGPPCGAHLAALFVALAPGSVLLSVTPMSEALWGALLTAVVFVLARAASPPRARDLALASALVAAATYVRPQAMLLAPLLPALLDGNLRQRLARAAIVTVAVLALVAPWTARNCRALDGCALVSTNGGSNLAIGAVPRATGQYLRLTADDGCRGVKGERARERCWQSVAWASVRADPGRWLRLAWPKLRETWSHESYPAGYLRAARPDLVDAAREASLQRWMSRSWAALWMVALVGLLRALWRRALPLAGRLSLAVIVAVTATHAVVFGGDRYHLPLVGFVAVLAAAGVPRSPWRSGRFRTHTASSSLKSSPPA